ncbi:hypothetical protein [Actinacidiphila alni]
MNTTTAGPAHCATSFPGSFPDSFPVRPRHTGNEFLGTVHGKSTT